MPQAGPAESIASQTPRLASQIRSNRVSSPSAREKASAPVRGRGPYHCPERGPKRMTVHGSPLAEIAA